MPAAPLTFDEAQRLVAVDRLRLLGTPAEERFDKLTRMARRLFGVPIAAVDIVGATKVWLKSVQGFPGVENPRETSYCAWTILEDRTCHVPDARLDPRLVGNPYASSLLFYAGCPLKSDGHNVGTFCIAGTEARVLTADELSVLRDLADLAEHEINVARMSEAQLHLARSVDELSRRANVDTLTHLWNRGAILDILQRELSSAFDANTPLAVALLDIDHFKRINDTQGHDAGDAALRIIARCLRQCTRPTDAVGRYGGEEFVVVLPGCASPMAAADNIRAAVAQTGAATVSVGVTSLLYGDTPGSMVTRADAAMYLAKTSGRNRARLG